MGLCLLHGIIELCPLGGLLDKGKIMCLKLVINLLHFPTSA